MRRLILRSLILTVLFSGLAACDHPVPKGPGQKPAEVSDPGQENNADGLESGKEDASGLNVDTPKTTSGADLPEQTELPPAKSASTKEPWPGQSDSQAPHLFGQNENEQKMIARLDDAGKKRIVRINAIRTLLAKSGIKSEEACLTERQAISDSLAPLVYELTSKVGQVDENYDKSLSDVEVKAQAFRFGDCAAGEAVTATPQ